MSAPARARLDTRRLGHILDRLSSNFDGEALAAGRRAAAIVRAAGVSWDELLEPQVRPPDADSDGLDDLGDSREVEAYCRKFARPLLGAPAGTELLGEWESRFLWSLMACRRPLSVSDFDPSGWQMPISVARKLQALRCSHFPDLNIEVHRAALLPEQVKPLDLPSTPLKLTEKRADRWREHWGHEQTEIDALAALMPDELDRIARAALAPFHDPTLAQRNNARAERWRRSAQQRLDSDPHAAAARLRIKQAHKALQRATTSFNSEVASAINTLPNIIPPYRFAPRQPHLGGAAPEPLFTTRDDYAAATRKLIASKTLVALVRQQHSDVLDSWGYKNARNR